MTAAELAHKHVASDPRKRSEFVQGRRVIDIVSKALEDDDQVGCVRPAWL